jgi:hypothetical protein
MRDKVINLLTSLKLTVVCLLFGLVLVFVGTMAQADEGLYQAQARYFKHWFVPSFTMFGKTLPIPLPGGYLVGTVLLINLVAAHAKRFVFSKKKIGIFLVHVGLVLLLVGQLLTDILSTESALRIEEGETKNYSEDFHANELVVIDTSDAKDDRVVSIPEKMVAAKNDIHDGSLPFTVRVRDYWVNADLDDAVPPEAKPVAVTAGSHTNSLVLALPASDSRQARATVWFELVSSKGSLGTYLVQARDMEEQSFTLDDRTFGMSVMFAPMMGGNNLIFRDPDSARRDNMINIPETELVPNAEIRREGLPVTVKVREFWANGRIYRQPGANAVRPAATQGTLTDVVLTPRPPVTEMDSRNLPAALVEIVTPKGPLGSWLVTSATRTKQEFTYENKTYQLAMRFFRHYKPYNLTLLDFTHERYKGTTKPKNFASRIRLQHPVTGEDREVLIRMNTPLRYDGLTFYQASFEPGDKVTILQVVRNPGWLTPYLACILVSAGLIIQFLTHLIGFATKRRTA